MPGKFVATEMDKEERVFWRGLRGSKGVFEKTIPKSGGGGERGAHLVNVLVGILFLPGSWRN